MFIKDIREFRTYYKEEVNDLKDENRNEHFVGQKKTLPDQKKIYGFFHIYHGDKADIRKGNFLNSFLDMAKDTQVVYELIQNAVDADSTHFYLFYDDEYVLVLNNGEQFNFEGIRSILNVGSSTKDEHSDIGKFGIGFKLVHRLIGESSGINELTTEYSGPILFSWAEKSQFEELLNLKSLKEIQPKSQKYQSVLDKEKEIEQHECLDKEPWFFKILVTNFPCQPDEEVYDIDYNLTKDLFNETEVLKLVEWLNLYKDKIDLSEFSCGSLFFLKLGKGKRSYLEDENLDQGLRISLSVLNKTAEVSGKRGLRYVYLNSDTPIEPADLEFEKFTFTPDSREYEYIAPMRLEGEEKTNIEILFGYCRDYRQSIQLIKGFPNFYLFFPLADEVHNLHFIVHSNAFYNGSHRNNLHVGGEGNDKSQFGINERLLETFADKLIEKLDTYKQLDREKYLAIYAALLLSGKATERHKRWVDKPLYEPLLAYIQDNIPTQSGNNQWCLPEQYVRIKRTDLALQPPDFGISEVEWFYWTDEQLISQASLFNENGNEKIDSKLSLRDWTIRDIISALESDDQLERFNQWIRKIEKTNPDEFYTLLIEINDNIGYNPPESFTNKFLSLKLFKFAERFYSVNELAGKEHRNKIFLMEHIEEIKTELELLGFTLSEVNFSDDMFRRVRFIVGKRLPYLHKDEILLEMIQQAILEKESSLAIQQKKNLLAIFIQNFDRKLREKLPGLILFHNITGELKPLNRLLPHVTFEYPKWLHSFMINEEEYCPDLQEDYFVQTENIFKDIIFENWENLILSPEVRKDIPSFYGEVIDFFNFKSKENPYLSGKPYIFINNEVGFVPKQEVFYHELLTEEVFRDDPDLQNAIRKLTGKQLPNKDIVAYLRQPPFQTSPDYFKNTDIKKGAVLSGSEVVSLLKFTRMKHEPFFMLFYIEKTEHPDQFLVSPREEKYQCYIEPEKPRLRNFIESQEKLKNYLKILPEQFFAPNAPNEGILKESAIYKLLLNPEIIKSLSLESSSELVDVFAESNHRSASLRYLSMLSNIIIKEGKTYTRETYLHKLFTLASRYLGEKGAEEFQQNFHEKVYIQDKQGNVRRIGEIAENNTISFTNEQSGKTLSLDLSTILPRFRETSGLMDAIMNQFVDFNDKEKLKKTIFKVGAAKRKSAILKELQQNYKVLENAHQLAFVVMYAYQQKELAKALSVFKHFQVKTLSGNTNLAQGCFYIRELSFGSPSHILSGYDGIEDLLHLNSETPAISLNGIPLIALYSYFDKNRYICPPVAETNQNDTSSKLALFSDIYEKWQNRKPSSVKFVTTDYQRLFDRQGKVVVSFETLFGFNPTQKVYPGEFAFQSDAPRESEELPGWILNWIRQKDIDEKLQFLRALGVNIYDSMVIKLRGSFKKINDFPVEEMAKKFSGQTHLLLNTLKWLANNENIVLSTPAELELVKEIYRLINPEDAPNIPYLTVHSIKGNQIFCRVEWTDHKLFSFRLKELSTQLHQYQPMVSLEQVFNTVREHGGRLICLDFYPQNWQEIAATPVVITQRLHIEQIQKEGTELRRLFYRSWKEALNNRFQIFTYADAVPYHLLINGYPCAVIHRNQPDIDEETGIICITNASSKGMMQQLDRIINRAGFTREVLNLLEEKYRSEAKELERMYADLHKAPSADELKQVEAQNSTFFGKREREDFRSKLLQLLNSQNSRWKGYIYHYTHLENAAQILQDRLLLNRNDLENDPEKHFKDSAGAALLHETHPNVMGCARFYFRPLTPSQWHVEALGRGILPGAPKCPVPVFFKIGLEDVLTRYEPSCYLSNGSLATVWALAGGTYDFLKKFDFQNVYKNYGEVDFHTYLRASQQEFLVEGKLYLDDLTVEIICRNEQDKLALIDLIGKEHPAVQNIVVDPTYFFNENPTVMIDSSADSVSASIVGKQKVNGYLRFSSNQSKETPPLKIDADTEFTVHVGKEVGYSIYFVDESEEWLVYSYHPLSSFKELSSTELETVTRNGFSSKNGEGYMKPESREENTVAVQPEETSSENTPPVKIDDVPRNGNGIKYENSHEVLREAEHEVATADIEAAGGSSSRLDNYRPYLRHRKTLGEKISEGWLSRVLAKLSGKKEKRKNKGQ